MTDTRAIEAAIAAPGDLDAPARSLRYRLEPTILGVSGILVLLLLWEVLPRIVTMSAGTKLFFTTPSQVAGTLWRLFATGEIWTPLGVSASGFALGLGLSIVVGLPLGVLIGRSRTLNAMLDPFITAFNATPRLVFLPLLMLWFGLGLEMKVVIVFIGALFPLLINTYEGVRNADRTLINVVRSFGASEWDVARLVVVPNAMPYIIAGLRLAIGRAVLGVVVAEFFGSESGLGVMMVRAAGRYQVDVVFSGLIVFATLSLAMTAMVQVLENRLSRWRPQRSGGEYTQMLPLAGVRVIAVEQYGAGPFGSMLLGDLGAEVIKIENPADGGDVGRAVGPHSFGPGDSYFFHAYNRNKKSLTLNLKHPDARRVLHDLVRSADATLDNLRGDQPEKLGVTYDALKAANPRIVCAHLSAYGRDGARKAWPGYDYLMQAEAGYLALTGEPDGPPSRMGLSVVDQMAGLYAAFALVSGVMSARSTGIGRDIDVSLFDTALQNLTYLAVWYLNAGVNQGREPRSSHPSLTPSQLYKTRDGFIFIMCNKEKFWPVLCETIGRPEWSTRPDYKDFAARLSNRDKLTVELDAALSLRTTAEWIGVFAGRVPAAPVHDVKAALDSVVASGDGRVRTVARPGGDIRLLTSPVRCPGDEAPCEAAPALGSDTDDILIQLGYARTEIARLRAAGAL